MSNEVKREPWGTVVFKPCPSCGSEGATEKRYCESICMRVTHRRGAFADATTYASKSEPHVHHTCRNCGFERITETWQEYTDLGGSTPRNPLGD